MQWRKKEQVIVAAPGLDVRSELALRKYAEGTTEELIVPCVDERLSGAYTENAEVVEVARFTSGELKITGGKKWVPDESEEGGHFEDAKSSGGRRCRLPLAGDHGEGGGEGGDRCNVE